MAIAKLMTAAALSVLLVACASQRAHRSSLADLQAEVLRTERAFAKTMTDRDFSAFQTFLAQESVFFDGRTPLVGPAAISANWKPLYAGAQAPFSWDPEHVEVLTTRDLALSTGSVRNPQGKIVGQFNSIWRRVGPGAWKVVFDKGCSACPCATP